MASHLLPLTLSVTVVIDVRHAYIITLPALFINPSDYLTVTNITSGKSGVSVKYEYEKTSHASVKAWLVFQNQIFIYVERQRSGACAGNKAVAQSSPLDASIGALVRTHVR